MVTSATVSWKQYDDPGRRADNHEGMQGPIRCRGLRSGYPRPGQLMFHTYHVNCEHGNSLYGPPQSDVGCFRRLETLLSQSPTPAMLQSLTKRHWDNDRALFRPLSSQINKRSVVPASARKRILPLSVLEHDIVSTVIPREKWKPEPKFTRTVHDYYHRCLTKPGRVDLDIVGTLQGRAELIQLSQTPY